MKKLLFVMAVFAVMLCITACQSAEPVDLGKDFDKVYSNYSEALNLDGAETYTVKTGDTLTDITKKFYGEENGYYFPLIMMASKDVVKDPELIRPGMKLTVPKLEANINDSERAKKLSPYFKDIANVYKLKHTNASANIRENLLNISEALKSK